MESPAQEITVKHLEAALQTLYNDPNPQHKDAAQKWLIKAQRDPSAWSWCFELLQPGHPTEVQYFGANVLHFKIANCWNEVPKDKVDELRQNILEVVFHYAPGPRIVLTRVCVALSALVIHLVTDYWETAVKDIIDTLRNVEYGGTSILDRFVALLEILTVLPEEYQTSRLDKATRRDVRNGLTRGADHVLQLLLQIMNDATSDTTAKEKSLKCLASWLALDLPPNLTSSHIHQCFQFIRDSNLFEVSVEAILAAVASPMAHQYPDSIQDYFPKVIQLDDMLTEAIKTQDQESLLGLSKIICSLCENHTRLLLAKFDPHGARLIQMVLRISGIELQYPTEEMASPISFSFWYSLQDEFESMDRLRQQNWSRLIHTLFYQLVERLIIKCKHPNMDKWSAEEKEQYRVYRIDVSDTLMYVYNLLNVNMLHYMVDLLRRQMATAPGDWSTVESLLFCFYSIVESCEAEGDFILPVVEILPKLDMTNPYLADTAMYTVGALAEWLMDRVDFLPILLPIVMPGLQKENLALTAVLTLKRITRECRFSLSRTGLSHQLVVGMREALHMGHLKHQESGWLIQSIGHVLSTLEEGECIRELEVTITRYVQRIEAIANIPHVNQHNKAQIIQDVSLLSNLQSTLDRAATDAEGNIVVLNQRPAAMLAAKVTPLFKLILQQYYGDNDILQCICHFFDKSIRTMVEHAAEVISPIIELLVDIVASNATPSAIDLVQQILLLYCDTKKEECSRLLLSVGGTIHHLVKAGGIQHHPDLVGACLDLYSNLMRKKSEFLIAAPAIPLGVDCPGVPLLDHVGKLINHGLYFAEQPVVKASVAFITESARQNVKIVQDFIAHFGQLWTCALLEGITGNAGRSLLDYIGDGLFALSKPNISHFAGWLNCWKIERLKNFEKQNGKESDIQRDTFIQQLLRERSNKRRYREICHQFSLMARGLHGVS